MEAFVDFYSTNEWSLIWPEIALALAALAILVIDLFGKDKFSGKTGFDYSCHPHLLLRLMMLLRLHHHDLFPPLGMSMVFLCNSMVFLYSKTEVILVET